MSTSARSTSLVETRSLHRSRQDNTFKTAKFLGTLEANQGISRFRARGSIDKADPIDIYKISIAAGAVATTTLDTIKVQKGSVRFSIYLGVGTNIQFGSSARIRKGTQAIPADGFGVAPIQFDTYIVFDRPTQNTRYTYTLTVQP